MPELKEGQKTTTTKPATAKNSAINFSAGSMPKIGLNKKINDAITQVVKSIKDYDFENARNIIKENHNFKDVIVNSKEVINACKDRLIKCLNEDRIDNASKIVSFMKEQDISKDEIKKIFNSKEVINAYKDKLIDYLRKGFIYDADILVSLMKEHDITKDEIKKIFNSNEIINAFKDGLAKYLYEGWIDDASGIVSFMKEQDISKEKINEIIINACKEGIFDNLKRGWFYAANSTISFMKKQDIDKNEIKKIFNSNEIIVSCKDGLATCLYNGWIDDVSEIVSFMKEQGISKEKINEIIINDCKDGLVKYLHEGWINSTNKIVDLMKEQGIEIKPLIALKEKLGCDSIKDLCEYDNEFLSYVIKNDITDLSFLEHIKEKLNDNVIKKFGLYALLKEYEETDNLDFGNDKEKLYEVFKKHDERWQDEANINNPFEEGAKVFGYDKMFKYLNSKNLNFHDALYNFHTICTLSKKDSLGPEHFFNNILSQVAKDGGNYIEGSAYNHFNSISNSLKDDNISQILEDAKSLVNALDDIKELLDIFKSKEDVFSSWQNLKKFMTLKELLEKGKLLEELAELKKEDKALYNYIKPLLFHKDSKVDRNAVIEFWKEPDKFFARIDSIAGPMHESLRPSNYSKYGLSGKELQQAIVQGKLDDLQLIRPCEITYCVRNITLSEALKRALGERGEGAESKEPTKIFNKIKKLGLTLQDIKDIKNGKEISDAIKEKTSDDIEEKIWEILEEDETMKSKISKTVVKATIHKKSDPFGALVGDDTACCMPFGSGKMNEYLTNLGTAIFSVRIQNADGSWRTIAQSVLTADIDIGKQVSNILGNIKNENLSDIPIDSLGKPLVLTCDNVEVARNYQNDEYISLIEDTYKEFFRTYLRIYGESINLDTSKIVIGKGYSDALRGLNEEINTYIPASVIGYSDNWDNKCYILNIDNKENKEFNILEQNNSLVTPSSKMGKYKIKRINVQDILPIARLEENIYSQSGLKEGLAQMQNEIIANLILCEKQNKPCFMFIISNKNNKPLGYIIGYEREEDGEKGIYISDFAMLNNKNIKSTSSAILITFLEKYKEAYQDKEAFPPIFAEFRESTSYELIKDKSKLNKLFSHFGLKATVKEHETEERGNETFHNCTLYVEKI